MAITIKKITYGFHVNGNDKDWDTQVGAVLIRSGEVVAQRYDFNHDKNVDHWDNNSDHGPWDIPITIPFGPAELRNMTYRVTSSPNGNDTWEYNAFLHMDFTDGTQRDWSWANQTLVNHDHHDYSLN